MHGASGLCAENRGTNDVSLLLGVIGLLKHCGHPAGRGRNGFRAHRRQWCAPPHIGRRLALRVRRTGGTRCQEQSVRRDILGDHCADGVRIWQRREELLGRVRREVLEVEVHCREHAVEINVARPGGREVFRLQHEANFTSRRRAEPVQPLAALLRIQRAGRQLHINGVHHCRAVKHTPVDA